MFRSLFLPVTTLGVYLVFSADLVAQSSELNTLSTDLERRIELDKQINRMNVPQRQQFRAIEKQLTQQGFDQQKPFDRNDPFGLDKTIELDNPIGRESWFIIVGQDQAQAVANRVDRSTGGYVTTYTQITEVQIAKATDAVLVKGEEHAALAVMKFLYNQNQAAARLPVAGQNAQAAGGNKHWYSLKFQDEDKARKAYARFKPLQSDPSKNKRVK